MKTIKSILIAATLIVASAVSTLSAQQDAQPAQAHQWNVAIGDSVMIKRECQKYLTGETPSVWVWDKVHTVRQLGTKRFPEGVLLMNIYSWICEDCLVNVNGKAEETAAAAVVEQAEVRTEFEQKAAAPAKEAPAEEPAQEEEAPVVPVVVPVMVPEPAPVEEVVVVEETVVVEEVPTEAVAEEAAPAQETNQAQEMVEQVKGDSIHSSQLVLNGKYDRFTIGVRGGASALLHTVKLGNWTCGGDVLLDLQYAHYWTKVGRPVDLGIITGLGIGYSRSGMKAAVDSKGTVTDEDGMKIDYTIKADEVKENDDQIQLEIPLMFSLIHENGLFFNVGARFMLPVYTPFGQKISNNENTYIDAYFQDLGVNVTNEEITGKLADSQYKTSGSDNGNQFTINIMLGAEIGYEWKLKSGNSLGLGAYANYAVFNSFKNDKTSTMPLIQVTPATNTSSAVVDVLSATKTYADKLGYFDAGIKLAYHFNFPKKRKNNDAKLFE